MKDKIRQLPNIFPQMGPVTQAVLFTDYSDSVPDTTWEQWQHECAVLIEHGLAGVALRFCRRHGVGLPPHCSEQLERAYFREVTTTFQMLQRTVTGLDALRAAGVPFVVTKGPGIALAGHPYSERTFTDVDVMVPHKEFREALRILEGLRYTERDASRQPWPSHRWIAREATNLRTPEGGSIDLHHHISPWNWSEGLSFDELRSRAFDSICGGAVFPLVSNEDNLFIAALHVVSDKSQPGHSFRVWRDLLVLSEVSQLDRVSELAEVSSLGGWLQWILTCLPPQVRPDHLIERLSRQKLHVRYGFRLRHLLHTERGHLLNGMYRIPLPNALLAIGGSLVPSPTYVRHEYPGTAHGYVKRWSRLMSRSPLAARQDIA